MSCVRNEPNGKWDSAIWLKLRAIIHNTNRISKFTTPGIPNLSDILVTDQTRRCLISVVVGEQVFQRDMAVSLWIFSDHCKLLF